MKTLNWLNGLGRTLILNNLLSCYEFGGFIRLGLLSTYLEGTYVSWTPDDSLFILSSHIKARAKDTGKSVISYASLDQTINILVYLFKHFCLKRFDIPSLVLAREDSIFARERVDKKNLLSILSIDGDIEKVFSAQLITKSIEKMEFKNNIHLNPP